MPDGATVKIEGLAKLESNMLKLAEDLNKRACIEAARAGANVLRKAIEERLRSTFKSHTGRAYKSIRISWRIRGRGVSGATVWFNVGLGKDSAGVVPFYMRFWELGFQHIGRGAKQRNIHRRKLHKGLRGIGKHYQRPFMGPAFEAFKQQAVDALADKLRAFVEEYRPQL